MSSMDWEVVKVEKSKENGWYRVHGVNRCCNDTPFCWDVVNFCGRYFRTDTTEITEEAAMLMLRSCHRIRHSSEFLREDSYSSIARFLKDDVEPTRFQRRLSRVNPRGL